MWIIVGICMWILLFVMFSSSQILASAQEQPRVLITFDEGVSHDDVLMMQNLVDHFSVKSEIQALLDVSENDLNAYDYTIFLDSGSVQFRKKAEKALGTVDQPLMWIGAGDPNKMHHVHTIHYQSQTYHGQNVPIYHLERNEEMQIYALASDGAQEWVLAAQEENRWMIASKQFFGIIGLVQADLLHDFFETNQTKHHPAFIKIDGVHPQSDPEQLRKIAEMFERNRTPYIVAVTPMYVDPTQGIRVALHDRPQVVQALRDMTERGVSILLHGFTHQYGNSITGNGYEFWDAARNQPIANEQQVIEEKLNKGIAYLVKHELYPIGFVPPLNVMSELGYDIASQYFSTLVGRVQVSDENYLKQQTIPFELKENKYGMHVIPETVGRFNGQPGDRQVMMSRLQHMLIVRNSVVGVTFQADMPIEQMEELLTIFREAPVDVMDFRDHAYTVHTDFVVLNNSGDGFIDVAITDEAQFSSLNQPTERGRTLLALGTRYFTWALAVLVAVFVLMFVMFIFILKRKRRIRLFDETEMVEHVQR